MRIAAGVRVKRAVTWIASMRESVELGLEASQGHSKPITLTGVNL